MKKKFLIGILLIIVFVLHEYLRYVYPETIVFRSVLKFIMSIVPVLIVISGIKKYEKSRTSFYYLILTAMIICCIGDLVINYSSIGGIVVFMLAQICLIVAFVRGQSVSVARIIAWVILWLLTLVVCIFIMGKNPPGVTIIIGGMIYIGIMYMMVISSTVHSPTIITGALFFGMSDLILVYNTLAGETLLRHIVSLGAYYIGITIISMDIFRKSRLK